MYGFNVLFETNARSAQAVAAALTKRTDSIQLMNWMHLVVEPFIKRRIEGRFNSEGDDVSGKWHPLTRATQMLRASRGYPPDHPINVRTGSMESWLLVSPSDIKMQGPEVELTHPGPTGSALLQEKLRVAQEGLSRPKTPPRPVLGFNDNDLMFITSELTAYLLEGVTP